MTTTTGKGTALADHESHRGASDISGTCTASRHGTADAYNHHHCRCPLARQDLRRQVKRRQLAHLEGRPPIVDATGTRRRLRALAVVGHSLATLGSHLGVAKNTVHSWRTAAVVTRATHDRVAALYASYADLAPIGPRVARTRNDALRAGWLGPLWWDDDTIDDPTHDPTPGTTCRSATGPGRPRLSLSQDVDPIVVERLTSGDERTPANTAERYAAYALLRGRGLTATRACDQLNLSPSARTLFADTYDREHAMEVAG